MSESQKIPSKTDNFFGWYEAVVIQSKLAAYNPMDGRMEMRPGGYAIWANMHSALKTFMESYEPKDVDEASYLCHVFCRDILAIPTIIERGNENENLTDVAWWHLVKGTLSDKSSIRIDIADCLGDLFLKMAETNFIGSNNYTKINHTKMTDWDFIARLIEAIIVVHGDNHGLILPPKIAPIQVMIIPTAIEMISTAERIRKKLSDSSIRVKVDDRLDIQVDERIYNSEIRGIPIWIEVSPKEAEHGKVSVNLRHPYGEKFFISFRSGIIYNLPSSIRTMLEHIQYSLLERASK